MHKTRLIVGCGYVGERVAKCWRNRGDRVLAITRSPDKAIRMRDQKWEPVVWDWLQDDSGPISRMPRLDTVLIAVSHAPVEGIPAEETHTRGLARLAPSILSASPEAKWIYLSTTGVFAAVDDGSWVDEESPVGPTRPGSVAALAGERWIESHLTSAHRVVLRPAGIYGPKRVPRWDAIRNALPLKVDPDSYLNLIHVDDLAMVIDWAAEAPLGDAERGDERGNSATPIDNLYCVCDGNSPRRRDYYQTIADWMHWPAPIFDTDSQRQSRSEGNKRVCAEKLLRNLPTPLQYPSYREGLKSLMSEIPS
jgi:nucleoside-diphosphate-sugar epimerase